MSSVKITGTQGYKKNLKKFHDALEDYRIVLINVMTKEMHRIGLLIRTEARRRLLPNGYGLDTGTLRSRVDYKVMAWNEMQVGIYEDAAHPPTGNISKYTGKRRSTSDKYANKVHSRHPRVKGFLQQTVDIYAQKELERSISTFIKDYKGKLR